MGTKVSCKLDKTHELNMIENIVERIMKGNAVFADLRTLPCRECVHLKFESFEKLTISMFRGKIKMYFDF